MKIFGIGTDIINIKRINNSIKRGGLNFKKKIFSDREIKYCEGWSPFDMECRCMQIEGGFSEYRVA